ncbi:MAG TPA: gluconate transporter [Hyphomonas sp.]|jgi:gluconate transporter|uniref:GntP family permease n=1 Tax=unclassified Hyphomonas TaxID=2630699 RepID=UPI000C8B7995|nr:MULTISPECIES: gluconate:H+ symporter [unclassified Hyphomonas]MAL42438.1 gluconate transporter [Hyphomonas sp.]HAO36879.1 gluconate transporter [Hyphomonas sp.]HAW57258.1 gluconate transporter [Hyphomonas sp.]HBJ40021.1 gluconate transporter [Hyphomonas sp.]HBU35170.1 gluconate transporter [Hyphomonas sp.]|tara:strand:+ start:3265 stop:4635 length:1371 start_codon:yes stop_codon:yes gene_type:complete
MELTEAILVYRPLLATGFGIAALLALILRARMNAFAALLLVSIFSALAAGMAPEQAFDTLAKGLGGTLGFIATVIGLGALFGAILQASGALDALASKLSTSSSFKTNQWKIAGIGLLASTPVFFDVALIILAPLILTMAHDRLKPAMSLGLPLMAGLAVGHAFLPPTPGPIAIAELIGADLGWVILFGAITGCVALAVSGPLFAAFLEQRNRMPIGNPAFELDETSNHTTRPIPQPERAIFLITLPLVLILLGTLAGILPDGPIKYVLEIIGHPFSALLIACGASWLLLYPKTVQSRKLMSDAMARAFEPTGAVILVTGAGGAFKQVLVDTGAGEQIANAALGLGFGPLLAGYVLAVILRLAQGSSTVAMITSAGLTAPIVAMADLSAPQLGIVAIAIAAGATTGSHVNDSGFWLVGRIFGITPGETLRTWTVSTTLISVVGFLMCLILYAALALF